MPLLVNLRHLENHRLSLEGEIPVGELDIDTRDIVMEVRHPLRYALEVQKLQEGLLVHGTLQLPLDCQCVRCLKPFQTNVILNDWSLHLPFQGEDAVKVVNDCVDLTPLLREDILLEFPQHPLCSQECHGLSFNHDSPPGATLSSSHAQSESSAWDELDKLKLKE